MSGDYTLEDSVYILFTTRAFATGIPGVLSAATVAVYEDVTATPIETSIAVTETLNSINGLNAVTIAALAASGYNAGGHYHVVIEAGTVDSVSVVGEVVGHFTIAASAAAEDLANGTDGLGAIKAETALILTDTGTTLDGKLNTAQADLDTITDADGVILGAAGVNLIWDEAMTETTGAPAVTGSFRDALKWMFALSRNKITQNATTTTLRNDADGADLATSTVSDDATTYTRGEWST